LCACTWYGKRLVLWKSGDVEECGSGMRLYYNGSRNNYDRKDVVCVEPSLCRVRHHLVVGYGCQLLYRLHVILDLDSINQWSWQVHHNRLWAWAWPWSRYHFRQLSSDKSWITNVHTCETTGSRMHCKRIQDHDTLRTHDHDSTMQRTQMPPLDEISLNRLGSWDGWDGWDGYDDRSIEF